MKIIRFVFLIFILVETTSCKQEQLIKTQEFVGSFEGVATVVDRLAVGNKNDHFNFKIRGLNVDTTEQYCCSLNSTPKCPRVYDIYRLEIFRHDGNYFIWNDKIFYQDTIPRSNDFPLKLRNDSLVFDFSKDSVMTNNFIYHKYTYSYHNDFSLLYWAVSVKDESYGEGTIVYHRKDERSSSGGAYGKCHFLEVSNFVLTSR